MHTGLMSLIHAIEPLWPGKGSTTYMDAAVIVMLLAVCVPCPSLQDGSEAFLHKLAMATVIALDTSNPDITESSR